MVTANSELSNIFLHAGQGVEGKGESNIQAGAGRGESLEERADSHFNFDARVKRLPFEVLRLAATEPASDF